MNKIICGDALEVLKSMPDESVHCVVTSPPYWNLRDYGVEGQLGLEKTPELYVQHLVEIFREVKRVLRKDGIMFLNMGDCYWGSGKGSGGNYELNPLQAGNIGANYQVCKDAIKYPAHEHLKPKDLVGMPWRVAFALQADGWWLRCDGIWHKPNPMPESVRDRPTKSHEYLFLLTKSASYYYDQEAIREKDNPDGRKQTQHRGASKFDNTNPYQAQAHERWTGSRNARSVWTIATQPFPEAHFATFPEKLVEPCIKAGTSEKGCCPECGAAWVRIVERVAATSKDCPKTVAAHQARGGIGNPTGTVGQSGSGRIDGSNTTLGWRPSCECVKVVGRDSPAAMGEVEKKPLAPCVVLDPFIGSGTTAIVAKGLGRSYIGIDLNPQYVEMANRRLADTMPFFEEIQGT